jgi:glyoxylase-like metal-dependent hydrolase (beta-lactamase superfamily II)
MTLDMPIEGLLSSAPSRLPYQANVLIRSYLLQRDDGNAIVYNSPGVAEAARDIQNLGGASRLLINHAHEAMYGGPGLDASVFVHECDRAETAKSMQVTGVFAERQMIDGDLEVIPTPGHTPGTTSFLWDGGAHRFLFTGDFVWIENGEWKAVVLDSGLRGEYLTSLELIRDLDFDVLVPWGVTDDGPPVANTNPEETHQRIDAIIARVSAGGDR